MSVFGIFIRDYPILKIINLLLYSLLIYIILLIFNLLSYTLFFSIIFWVGVISCILAYLIYELNKYCIVLDTQFKQEIYFQETNQPALRNNLFTSGYKEWLIINAEREVREYYQPLNFNSSGECCIYCCATIILFLIISSFTLIYIPRENALLVATLVFLVIIIIYPTLRSISDRKMCKLFDSETKRIIYEEETGYSALRNGKFSIKYRTWLVQKAQQESNIRLL